MSRRIRFPERLSSMFKKKADEVVGPDFIKVGDSVLISGVNKILIVPIDTEIDHNSLSAVVGEYALEKLSNIMYKVHPIG